MVSVPSVHCRTFFPKDPCAVRNIPPDRTGGLQGMSFFMLLQLAEDRFFEIPSGSDKPKD